MPKNIAVIMDGVGINLKSTLINEARHYGYKCLESDSMWYQEMPSVFKLKNSYIGKIQARYLQIKALQSTCDSPIYVDRGLLNQLIWAKLCLDDVVDDYLGCKEDYKFLIDNAESIIELENKLNPVRVLCTTHRDDILLSSLDPTKYDSDVHAQMRIETFYDVDTYYKIQEKYVEIYNSYIKSYIHIRIDNTLPVERLIAPNFRSIQRWVSELL